MDEELVTRALRWCAKAGCRVSAEQVRAAMVPLAWDDLVAVRALLADEPPTRPLGPMALADLARGIPAEVASTRERDGYYRSPGMPPSPPGRGGPARARSSVPRLRQHGPVPPVVRSARERAAPTSIQPPPLPLLDELFASEGRAVLERLIRERGARRGQILEALGKGWRRKGGGTPCAADLSQLLDAHGLTRAFDRRERNELLHALRVAGGRTDTVAAALGILPGQLWAAFERLGARGEADAIRTAHRDELRRRATLAERTRMFLVEADRLADLELLAEVAADLRARLPEHMRALRASRAESLRTELARSLEIRPHQVDSLAALLGLDLCPATTRTSSARHAPPCRSKDEERVPSAKTGAAGSPRGDSFGTVPRKPHGRQPAPKSGKYGSR